MHDFWVFVVAAFAPFGLYCGLTDIGPWRPKVREGERALRWISDHVWRLIAVNGSAWGVAAVLAEKGFISAAITIFLLSLPAFTALTICGFTSIYRYIVDRGTEAQRRQRRSTRTPR